MDAERCGCAPCQGCSLTDLEAMRAELAETQQALTSEAGWRCKYEAAIARVRGLCEAGSPVRAAGLAEQVLHALDGGTE